MSSTFPPEEAPTSPCTYYALRQTEEPRFYWSGPGIGLSNFPYKVFVDEDEDMSAEDFSSFYRVEDGSFAREPINGPAVLPLPAEVAGKMYYPGEEFEGR